MFENTVPYFNFTLYKDNDFSFIIELKNEFNDCLNIKGYSIRMKVSKDVKIIDILNSSNKRISVLDAERGIVKVFFPNTVFKKYFHHLNHSEFSCLKNEFEYKIEILTGDEIRPILIGKITVK